MRISFLVYIASLLLAACSPVVPQEAATPVPTAPLLQGEVNITHPSNGSIIYAETLYLEGLARGLPSDGFRLRVLSANDEIIAETTVQPAEDETWTLELVHEYAGDPTEVTIFALPVDESISGDYDLVTAMFANLDFRPEGIYGQIINPAENDIVGGDVIPVIGTVSGINSPLTITLTQPDATVIDEEIVAITNPYRIDAVLWNTQLQRGDYTGPANLSVTYIDSQSGGLVTLHRIEIGISIAAG